MLHRGKTFWSKTFLPLAKTPCWHVENQDMWSALHVKLPLYDRKLLTWRDLPLIKKSGHWWPGQVDFVAILRWWWIHVGLLKSWTPLCAYDTRRSHDSCGPLLKDWQKDISLPKTKVWKRLFLKFVLKHRTFLSSSLMSKVSLRNFLECKFVSSRFDRGYSERSFQSVTIELMFMEESCRTPKVKCMSLVCTKTVRMPRRTIKHKTWD